MSDPGTQIVPASDNYADPVRPGLADCIDQVEKQRVFLNWDIASISSHQFTQVELQELPATIVANST
jgi:hypothetical protein